MKNNSNGAVSSCQESILLSGITASTRDPYVLCYDEHYYIYTTGWYVYQSCEDRLTGEFVYPEGTCVVAPPDYDGDPWAPEVYDYDGRFYMFTTYKSKMTGKRGCAVFVSNSPAGPFLPHSDGHITPSDKDYIDGSLYIDADNQPWMIYVKEWISMEDGIGRMLCAKLSTDLKTLISEPVEMFQATDPAWAAGIITDGPFLYRTQNGSLLMLWSNYDREGYCVGLAKSKSGAVTGPWVQMEEPLYSKKYTGVYDGGHGMIFTDMDGNMWMAMHSPNTATEVAQERTVFIPLKEEKDALVWDRKRNVRKDAPNMSKE